MQNTYYQSQLKIAQTFSNDTGISIDRVLALPFYFIPSYYKSDAWKIREEALKNDAQIQKNLFQHLSNLQVGLKNISSNLSRVRE